MEQQTLEILFALLRSAVEGTGLSEHQRNNYSREMLRELLRISSKYDVIHLLVYGLKQNGLLTGEDAELEKHIFKAAYRYERLQYDYESLCEALESAQIAFLPLKGSVLRRFYPEAWMRTSCDVDILVHQEDLEKAVACLTDKLQYAEKERTTHDVSLFSPMGTNAELHFDLVEEGRANNAIEILSSVWEYSSPRENSGYWYEMSDEYFYFYHVAHMAKHFETGGCGIRPFIDLMILDGIVEADVDARDRLLERGGLLKFAEVSRRLCKVWFGTEEPDATLLKLQDYLLRGGIYGSADNRVAIQQTKKGGRFGYILSRIFVPTSKLKRYYPILNKHPWLMPIMQIRRWFMLLRPDVARLAKRELAANTKNETSSSDEMTSFLSDIGLN